MEEIVQILIFVGAMVIAVVGQSAKNKKKPVIPSYEEVLEDMFPDIELQTTSTAEAQPLRPVTRKAPSKPRPSMKEPHKSTLPSVSKQVPKIRINTREEARRAFIHSEIFNRKY